MNANRFGSVSNVLGGQLANAFPSARQRLNNFLGYLIDNLGNFFATDINDRLIYF